MCSASYPMGGKMFASHYVSPLVNEMPDEITTITKENARSTLHDDTSPRKILVLNSSELSDFESVLSDISIRDVFVLNDGAGDNVIAKVHDNRIRLVNNRKQLMFNLNTGNMLCYVTSALDYRDTGDIGLFNDCISQAIKCLHAARRF